MGLEEKIDCIQLAKGFSKYLDIKEVSLFSKVKDIITNPMRSANILIDYFSMSDEERLQASQGEMRLARLRSKLEKSYTDLGLKTNSEKDAYRIASYTKIHLTPCSDYEEISPEKYDERILEAIQKSADEVESEYRAMYYKSVTVNSNFVSEASSWLSNELRSKLTPKGTVNLLDRAKITWLGNNFAIEYLPPEISIHFRKPSTTIFTPPKRH